MNLIILDNTGDQESNLEVHLFWSKNITGNSIYLKRKRFISNN